MKLSRIVGRVGVVALLALAVSSLGCKTSSSSRHDGGDGSIGDVKPNTDGMTGDRGDVGGPETIVCDTTGTPKGQGAACACDGQCSSHFCVDGVCCDSACKEGCKTCNAPDTVGKCVMRKAGDDPRDSSTCMKMAASTCSFDGKCDGAGGCRKYPENTQCKPGTCDGDAVVGSSVCDGMGHCKPGSTRICVPYTCNPSSGACFGSCTSSSQCVSGQACVQGSCGKLMIGASCETGDQCASGFCADKVCCNVACKGPCLSCNLTGREGRCWPLDADAADSRGICRDQGPTSCGQTGFCDGIGGCSKYARDTVCVDPTCSGNAKVNTAGTCNGLGTCQAQGIQDCHPFRCASGACTTACVTSADCDTGIACVNNTCGPKQDGQPCNDSSECQHNHCVDGVCCDQACTGACRSCGLAGMLMGKCTPIAAGTTDPRGMCQTKPQSSCGTNGKCDGNGGCQTWPVGTLCADETCTANVYKAPSTCNSSGQCVAPDLVPCSPYVCNGSRCFNACTNNTQCLTPNSCATNSCGKKDLGASCSTGDECKSTFCAQGVCCDQACDSACKSCVAGMLGNCTNVATGAIDPHNLCAAQDQSTCGTNGKCEAGACQKWSSGTPCKAATCTTNQATPLSTCDGAGTCVTPATRPCFPFTCGSDACLPSCTADNQCQSPAVCVNGSCGLKPNGAICLKKEECLSSFCEQGVCCESACTGVCKSCALTASPGVCSNVAAGGKDVSLRCSDQGAASCGTNGTCDGKGACALYDASTSCAGPSCPSGQSTAVTGRTCNGLGVCQPATNIPCSPYVCNGSTACLGACTGDSDCLPPNTCDPKTNRCGNLKRPGQACASTAECQTGYFCVDKVCCVSSACSLCTSCNVGASAGNCANVPLGSPDPSNRCAANPPCGNTGFCNGAAGCQLAATTVSCGTESCTGSTYTPISHCNGTGSCSAATSSSCTPYLCGGTTCRVNCAMDSHCLAPYTCQGTPPSRSCALKPNGAVCGAGNECISGSCVNGVCCGSSACGTCQTCNGTTPGTCTPLVAGTPAPTGQCTASASSACGNTGKCNGNSGCEQWSASTPCGAAVSCSGTTYQPASTCNGSGACNQQPTQSCGNYVCSGTMCLTSCTADTQCSSTTLYCNGSTSAPGSCVAKKANGATCNAAKECSSANCTDGVCCTTSSCGTCQSCSVSGNGTCANVQDNTGDPHSRCPSNGECGNTGLCVSGACQQQPASKTCGLAESCTGTTHQPISHCSGTGTCSQTATEGCGNYVCNGNTCRNDCTADAHCSSTSLYCTGNASTPGTCVAKIANGIGCTSSNQCGSGLCTDGVCCTTSSCPTCQMCNLNGAGTCSNVGVTTATVDPYGRCSNSGACGNTGFCLNGACMQQPATTPCGPTVSCSGATYQPQSYCSGSGTCSTMSPTGCGAYVCNGAGTACLTSCNGANGDADCASGHFCSGGTNGTCQPKKAPGGGNTCSLGHECTTGFCVDGYCCNMSGCGTCQTCASGSCGNSPDGQPEPHGGCSAAPPCGNTGTCTGGACTQAGTDVTCVSPFCTDVSTFQPEAKCNGLGSCSIPATQPCAPYTCSAGCRSTCADDTQCVGNTYCDAGVCRAKKSAGDGCGRDGECGGAYNHCTEGVCCNSAQCDSCQTCTASGGTAGSCHNVPGGLADPRSMCASQPASSCGTTGVCSGSGTCARYDTNTECSLACDGTNAPNVVTHTYCDVAGLCAGMTVMETCASGMCTSAGCTP